MPQTGCSFRAAADLWAHDISAHDFGEGGGGRCVEITRAASVNALSLETQQPGDLAVLGSHIMACLRPGEWIEAEPLPEIYKVISLHPGKAKRLVLPSGISKKKFSENHVFVQILRYLSYN